MRDIAFAAAAAALGTLCVRLFGIVALLLVPFVLGPLWPGTLQPVTGDDPHYLVIAQSVVADHDLAVQNNYREAPFNGQLRPHLGWDHRTSAYAEYSVHQPGTGILVSPGWDLDGRRGALTVVALAAALLIWEMVRLAEAFGANRSTAVLGGALVYLAPAVLDYGRVVLSEIFVAVCLVHLARAARSQRSTSDSRGPGAGIVVSASLAAAALPWIHLRYIVPAGLLTLVIAFRGSGLRRIAPLSAMLVSYAGVALAFQSWFGAPWPSAAYGPAAAGYDHEGLPTVRRVIGLLADNHVGLLFAAPVVVLALAALPLVWRRDRVWVVGTLSAVGVYLLIAAGWSGWWLGESTPGRNWTPIAPLAVPLVAAAMSLLSSRMRGIAVGVAVAIAAIFVSFPLSAYPRQNGVTTLYARFHVSGLAPSFRDGVGHTSLFVGLALVVVMAGVVAMSSRWLLRREPSSADEVSPALS